jgi:hypothetical protein
MASCNGDCADLNLDLDQGGKGLKWFKIDAKGYDPSKKRWASQDVIDGKRLSLCTSERSIGGVSWRFMDFDVAQRPQVWAVSGSTRDVGTWSRPTPYLANSS